MVVFNGAVAFNSDLSAWQIKHNCITKNIFYKTTAFVRTEFWCSGEWARVKLGPEDFGYGYGHGDDTAADHSGRLQQYGGTFQDRADFSCSDGKLRNLNIRDAIKKLYATSSSETGTTANTARDAIIAKHGEIANWDISRVTNMENLFVYIKNALNCGCPSDCGTQFCRGNWNPDLSSWVTSSVVTMKHLFNPKIVDGEYSLESFNSVISDWNVANVVNMESSKLFKIN